MERNKVHFLWKYSWSLKNIVWTAGGPLGCGFFNSKNNTIGSTVDWICWCKNMGTEGWLLDLNVRGFRCPWWVLQPIPCRYWGVSVNLQGKWRIDWRQADHFWDFGKSPIDKNMILWSKAMIMEKREQVQEMLMTEFGYVLWRRGVWGDFEGSSFGVNVNGNTVSRGTTHETNSRFWGEGF